MCASIATGIAGFASKHPAYPEKNLENTSFMKLWEVRLSKYNHDKHCRATSKPIEDSSICMEYEVPEAILFDNGDIREANITLETDESGQIIIRVTDCGGDEEYVFLTTLAITSKCLNLILFNSEKYGCHSSENPHQDSFYPMIGTYVDIILSQARDTVIGIVAGHYDESIPNDHILKRNNGQELKNIFKEVQDQIVMRTKEYDQRCSKIILLSDPNTKVFTISNKMKTRSPRD